MCSLHGMKYMFHMFYTEILQYKDKYFNINNNFRKSFTVSTETNHSLSRRRATIQQQKFILLFVLNTVKKLSNSQKVKERKHSVFGFSELFPGILDTRYHRAETIDVASFTEK